MEKNYIEIALNNSNSFISIHHICNTSSVLTFINICVVFIYSSDQYRVKCYIYVRLQRIYLRNLTIKRNWLQYCMYTHAWNTCIVNDQLPVYIGTYVSEHSKLHLSFIILSVIDLIRKQEILFSSSLRTSVLKKFILK